MTDTTEWTPERRAEREAQRAKLRAELSGRITALTWDEIIDHVLPAPPPEHTYGREIRAARPSASLRRRRSDGRWELLGVYSGEFVPDEGMTDAYARALAAEVPLTDAECDLLLGWGQLLEDPSPFARERRDVGRNSIRAAFVRVMCGEVTP